MSEYAANRLAPTGDPFLSPSRMEKIDSCLRAFGFRYDDEIKAPEKASATFGKVVHFKQQLYIITGVIPEAELVQIGAKKIDAGKVAIAGLQYLPLPHPSISTEHEFEYEAFPGIWFQGKIDIYDEERVRYQNVNADGSIVSAAFEIGDWSTEEVNGTELTYRDTEETWNAYDSRGNPIPLVIDHKSTGDFKWQKSDDALRATLHFKGDAQTGFYGEKAVRRFRERFGYAPEFVHFRWVYYLRSEKEHKARCTDLRLTPAEIREICGRWKANAEHAIALTRSKISGHDLPPSLDACQKFGGCEYGPPTKSSPGNLNICRLTSGERMRSAMTTQTPIAQQVAAALAGTGANPFASAAPPVASANPFATAPAATGGNPFASIQSPEAQTAGAQVNPFGGAAQAPAANANPFAVSAPVAAPAVAGNPFAAFQAPPAVAAVDPRLAECHPSIDPAQRAMYLAHCDKNGLDHRTGQPKGASPAVIPAIAPIATAPAATEADSYRALAQRMYAEKRRPDASAHPEVIRLFSALETINGPIPEVLAPVAEVLAPVAEVAAPKKRRKKKDANGQDTAEDDDSPQMLITVKAVQEVIAFLQSLIA